jgi:hypothetical protein
VPLWLSGARGGKAENTISFEIAMAMVEPLLFTKNRGLSFFCSL